MLCLRHRSLACRITSVLVVALVVAGCDVFSGFFQPGLTLVIENDTDFTAIPDFRLSGSRNILEDVFSETDSISDSSASREVGPNQIRSIRLGCDSDLESISFDGARFRDSSGFSFGNADSDNSWRRDVDFDCGDTIRIRLSGTVFFFNASSSVVQSSGTEVPGAAESGGGVEDIGNLIDRLLGR